MEVTRKNFEEMLPEIERRIKSCVFVSIDAEYTGLYAEEIKDSNSMFDTPAKRYQKLKRNLSKFSICQMGISLYEKDRDSSGYFVNAYNFYVFPLAFDAFSKRELLLSQVSCLNFLARNGFDFNKFIKEGVPYLNKQKAASLKKFLQVNRHFMNTCEFIDESYFSRKNDYLSDDEINGLVNKLEGFSKIIKIIQKCKKPLVGHNMLIDLVLIYSQFCEDLPESYTEFKKNLHTMFPVVFDTKCLAWGVHFIRQEFFPDDRTLSDTNLFALYSNISSFHQHIKPVIETVNETKVYQEALRIGISKNLETVSIACCHNAAFDAVVTGAVFLKLGFIACRPEPMISYNPGLTPTTAELFKRISCWKDEINLGRAIIPNINLSKSDPESKRPDWIRVRCATGGTTINPLYLRLELARFGDVEIEVISAVEVILACSNFGCARKVWNYLHEKGYRIEKIRVPNGETDHWNSLRLVAKLAVTGVLCILTVRWIRTRLTK